MNKLQQNFLKRISDSIPQLLETIAEGNEEASFILGTRNVDGKQVRLMLVAEVIDASGNSVGIQTNGD